MSIITNRLQIVHCIESTMSESNKRIKMTTPPTNIEFDVGGTVYKVSKSLLDMFPDTMLASLASPRWNQHSEQAESESTEQKPIFIDRNGERFQYVLDYMRDNGTVNLPPTISQDAVINDLEFFGFENVKTVGTFKLACPSTRNIIDTVQYFKTFFSEKDKAIKTLEEETERKRACFELAKVCFKDVQRTHVLSVNIYLCSPAEYVAKAIIQEKDGWRETFDSFLKGVGLKLSPEHGVRQINRLYVFKFHHTA